MLSQSQSLSQKFFLTLQCITNNLETWVHCTRTVTRKEKKSIPESCLKHENGPGIKDAQ